MATLGVKPDRFTFTSDSFELILAKCEELLRKGKAYCDDTDGETMKKEREERVESKHRNNCARARRLLCCRLLLALYVRRVLQRPRRTWRCGRR